MNSRWAEQSEDGSDAAAAVGVVAAAIGSRLPRHGRNVPFTDDRCTDRLLAVFEAEVGDFGEAGSAEVSAVEVATGGSGMIGMGRRST